jgi:16S rRNA (cytidine1402-2'-O)-methyltransferase
MPGTLFVVATPIGNLDDITLRALRVLREVTVIAAEDTRRTGHLLARHGITTSTTSLHEHNEHRKMPSLLDRLQRGDSIALVSDAGTPTVSDPGATLVQTAIALGIRVEPIPGPNAAVAALSVSGLLTDSFSFHGFPPTRSKDRKTWFRRLMQVGGVIVFYEAPHRIHSTLSELISTVGDRPAVIARELTKVHEQLVNGPISVVMSKLTGAKGEFTVVVDLGEPMVITDIVGETTEQQPINKRQAVTALAKKMGVAANDLYRAIERLEKLGQDTEDNLG